MHGMFSTQLSKSQCKLTARLLEAEQMAEAANAKVSGLEKAKNRLQGEIDDLIVETSTSIWRSLTLTVYS
jgi:hypothetical protein